MSFLPDFFLIGRRRGGQPLWLRHLAARRIGHVAVGAEHAPFHAPAGASKTEILTDGVIGHGFRAVGQKCLRHAKAAWNGVVAPRTIGDFTRLAEAADEKARIPEADFLDREV